MRSGALRPQDRNKATSLHRLHVLFLSPTYPVLCPAALVAWHITRTTETIQPNKHVSHRASKINVEHGEKYTSFATEWKFKLQNHKNKWAIFNIHLISINQCDQWMHIRHAASVTIQRQNWACIKWLFFNNKQIENTLYIFIFFPNAKNKNDELVRQWVCQLLATAGNFFNKARPPTEKATHAKWCTRPGTRTNAPSSHLPAPNYQASLPQSRPKKRVLITHTASQQV